MGRSRTWKPKEMAELAAMVSTNLSWSVIGAHFNRTPQAAQMKAASMGLGPKPYKGNRSPAWALIVHICKDRRPRSVHELVKLTGATRVCIDRLMKDRHDAGQAHVGDWLRSRKGPPAPLWLPVPGVDAPKPAPLRNADRQRERMRRMKKDDPLRYKAILDRTTVRRRLRKGVVTPQHPLIQALFGMEAPA